MKLDVCLAQLSIVDGTWQEAPEHLACFDAATLCEGNVARGALYIVVEVTGEPEGRDPLARELIETVRRAYAATRGSIALGLMHAIRAANDLFYTLNANTLPEARRIAGITAVILRANELFIAQGGPGVTCLLRQRTLIRYPDESPWFNPDPAQVAEWLSARNFATPGQVPIGMRRNYMPDIFHTTLLPNDLVLLATRSLVHLLTNEELIDTLAARHPDEIVTALEDVAGTTDLSVIALRVTSPTSEPLAAPLPAPDERPPAEVTTPPAEPPAPPPPPSEEELAWEHIRAEQARAQQRLQEEHARAQRRSAMARLLSAGAHITRALATAGARINWTRLGNAVDRALATLARATARVIVMVLDAITPGEHTQRRPAPASPRLRTAWKLAALVFPLVLILLGTVHWITYRTEQQTALERRMTQHIHAANGRLEEARRLATTERARARELVQEALQLIEQARALRPNDPRVASTWNRAQDLMDELNGITSLFPTPPFAHFAETRSQVTRIVARASDVFILDRGAQRIYRYVVNAVGSAATPVGSDGIILRAGERVDGRTVGEIFALVGLETGRVVALDRSGAYYLFDPQRNTWSARVAQEPTAWARATLAATYANNLYLIDPARQQILKYVSPSPEIIWTASVTYFAPGVTPPDMTTVIDMTIDGDIWLARADGSVARFYEGKPRDVIWRELDTPIAQALALVTTERMTALYLVDAGNQRVLQFDKVTGRLMRQFKPHSQTRDTFQALHALTVDEANRRFVFVNAGKAYLATIPP